MRGLRDTTEDVLRLIERGPAWLAIALTALALAGCWWIALESGSQIAVTRHWFYVPVVYGAIRFGALGAGTTAVVAGLLSGPLVFTVDGTDPALWATRTGFFLLVGLLVAGLVTVVRERITTTLQALERERELAEQRAALMQTVSHEFRTPLTVIRGVMETLQQRPDAVADAFRPLIASAARAERSLSEMVAVVLAAADATEQIQHLQQEPVAMPALLEDVTSSLAHGAHRVVTDVRPGAERIVTSPAHLRLALRELVTNALRFTPPSEPVEVWVAREEPHVKIRVRDHGEGIDPADVDAAMQPFVQLDPSTTRQFGGLGMGLFTARRLTEGLGGELTLRPAPTGGLDAIVTLPQQRASDHQLERRPQRVDNNV
ncbi:MAG: HAMP domain-containing sensor histidine kinase [Nitriliruptorales bacterium]|nr:HAMP domain-containing sensor histidine kinase [Nitriliruptorales bacterium]